MWKLAVWHGPGHLVQTNVSYMAAQFDQQVSGSEFSGLAVRTRPKPASRAAPKQPDGEPSIFLFRYREPAVRDLTDPANSGRLRSPEL
jgi:hypothetical protein